MAFTTIQGSGANDATTFVGTSGVDFIALAPGSATSLSNFFLSAQEAGDFIQFTSAKTYNLATLRGGDGNDSFALTTDTADTILNGVFINGNAGVDTINTTTSTIARSAAIFGSTFQGGAGNDIITVANLNGSVVNGNKDNDAIIVSGTASGANAANVSSIFGGQGADTITVSDKVSVSVIQGDDGNDLLNLSGQFADSTISGNAGDDRINLLTDATFSKTTVFGGAGNDIITTTVSAVISGDDGNDTIISSGSTAITVFGGTGNDTVNGGSGADTINGDAGNDSLSGAGGADTILGGDGDDTITGGTDVDSLTGGAGADRFVQGASDSKKSSGLSTATFTFTGGVDIVTDFNALQGDVLKGNNGLSSQVITIAAPTADGTYIIQGTLTGNAFLISVSGADLLYGSFDLTGGVAEKEMLENSIVLKGGFANFNVGINFTV